MPDGIVRPARTEEAAPLARIQHEAWRASYQALLPAAVIAALDAADTVPAWESALAADTARAAVLVAIEGDQLAGVTAFMPGADPDADDGDAELVTVAVIPGLRGHGHGSRLLHAAMQTAAETGVNRVYTWLPAADEAAHTFLLGAGWSPDGAERTLDLRGDGEVLVDQVRLHTSVA